MTPLRRPLWDVYFGIRFRSDPDQIKRYTYIGKIRFSNADLLLDQRSDWTIQIYPVISDKWFVQKENSIYRLSMPERVIPSMRILTTWTCQRNECPTPNSRPIRAHIPSFEASASAASIEGLMLRIGLELRTRSSVF